MFETTLFTPSKQFTWRENEELCLSNCSFQNMQYSLMMSLLFIWFSQNRKFWPGHPLPTLTAKKKKKNRWLFPEAESANDSRWVPRLTLTYPPRRHIGIASGKSTLSLLKWPWPLKWNVLLWCGKVILHHLFPCRSEKYPFIWHLNSLKKNFFNETFFWKVVVYYIRR